MRRRLVLLASALSGALFVASFDQWLLHGTGRGYFLSRESAKAADGSAWRTELSVGVDTVSLAGGRFPNGYLYPLRDDGRWQITLWLPTYSAPANRMPQEFMGFGWSNTHPRASDFLSIRVPMWFVVLVSALGALPFALGVRRSIYAMCRWIVGLPEKLRVWRWRRLGLCEGCGYDLTANVSGVCPECGTRPPDAA